DTGREQRFYKQPVGSYVLRKGNISCPKPCSESLRVPQWPPRNHPSLPGVMAYHDVVEHHHVGITSCCLQQGFQPLRPPCVIRVNDSEPGSLRCSDRKVSCSAWPQVSLGTNQADPGV